ncbi:MAG TPA: hypothetical protein VGN19_08070 [Pedococcus sp.]|jgi:hypothetical protein|nr:hypothetical protein [Pedococcus sp.]
MTNTVMTTQAASTISPLGQPMLLRRRLSALALAAAGVAIVAGHALSVDSGQSSNAYLADFTAHHVRGTIGGLTVAVGAFLLLPGLAAALRLVTGRGGRLATVAAGLWGFGAVALGAGDVMQTLVMSALVPAHRDTARAIIDVAQQGILGLPFLFAPAFILGGALFALALLRSHAVPTWLGVLSLVGPLLVPASSAGGLLSAALPLLPLGASLVLLAIRAGAGSRTTRLESTTTAPQTILGA